ncbi:transport permease protein [Vulcanimicrobium alpinum]|uniref:Transport permease protein n=1 Tax=Vulcanimicrobium alpinum TaxID=3016050 RepID=A0AAN2C945_UNVUL|nr:ABC transporter permease [Vulcanimicrobium alpinum]BDE05636.1 transport permease protein [Vulcanimicrobium alpinum]
MTNFVGFETLVKREMVRTFSIINQVIWPPVIQTLLYVFVFGLALGSRIHNVQGVSYAQFLIPGLIMLQVIDQTYSESSSSVFQGRFMNSIQELLIAPLSAAEIVFGYVVAGAVRALFIALLITLLGIVFVHTAPINWGLYVLTILLVAVLFSALGVIFGLMAEKFDHIAVLTTFFITPLVFVGGVFTSTQFLPPLVQKISLVNPMFHMIDAFRYSYTGTGDEPLGVALAIVTVLAAAALAVALSLTAAGYKLRT